jgi:hypothetical protein
MEEDERKGTGIRREEQRKERKTKEEKQRKKTEVEDDGGEQRKEEEKKKNQKNIEKKRRKERKTEDKEEAEGEVRDTAFIEAVEIEVAIWGCDVHRRRRVSAGWRQCRASGRQSNTDFI